MKIKPVFFILPLLSFQWLQAQSFSEGTFGRYLVALQDITKIEIPQEQGNALNTFIKKHWVVVGQREHATWNWFGRKSWWETIYSFDFRRLDTEALGLSQKDFVEKQELLKQSWADNVKKEWPTFVENEVAASCEVYSILPLVYGGPNEWWNVMPVTSAQHDEVLVLKVLTELFP